MKQRNASRYGGIRVCLMNESDVGEGKFLPSRIISGLIMAGGIIAVLILCDAWVMHLVIAIVGTIAALEYHAMSNPQGTFISRCLFTISARRSAYNL